MAFLSKIAVVLVLCSGFSALAQTTVAGNWRTSSIRCSGPAGVTTPSYSISIDLQMTSNNYVANGKVAGFSCRISGPYSQKGNAVTFTMGDDGGCPLGDYIGKKFVAAVKDNKMTIKFGTAVGDKLCPDTGSTVLVYLIR